MSEKDGREECRASGERRECGGHPYSLPPRLIFRWVPCTLAAHGCSYTAGLIWSHPVVNGYTSGGRWHIMAVQKGGEYGG